ncbi:MAG: glucuronate isomerase, partial [Promicromonosporaceae bacterium]|nr:glucuronate isomerase [Promicromonosporaceae bacterium]
MSPVKAELKLNPDRALSADPAIAPIARKIYDSVKDLPIISMHGHVPVEWFATNEPFPDPAQLLIVPDHYLLRMLFSQGVKYEDLGVPTTDGSPVETNPREIWRRFCANWKLFRGTPTRFWMEHVLHDVFGVKVRPSAETADEIYDQIEAEINKPDFRPRELLDRFNIEVIATTDPAWSDLAAHAQLAKEGYGHRILPTFRPDAVFALKSPTFAADVVATGKAAGVPVTDYPSFLAALRAQRLRFKAAGATATDHAAEVLSTEPLPEAEAEALFAKAFAGGKGDPDAITPEQAAAFQGNMLFESARMSTEDGLVMQIHPGVLRDYDPGMHEKFGTDKGFDIPVAVEYARAVRPMLAAFGRHPNFRVILFTIDEDVYSRELAPLAGVFPSVRLGAPWWFIDTPEAMLRFRETATETAGFYNTSGFVDDTRAFCSIPARHDLARRIDST